MVAQVSYDEFNEDRNLVSINRGKSLLDSDFGWGSTSVKWHRRCPMMSSMRTETLCRLTGEKLA